MSTPVQIMIADIDRKLGNLTELRKNLQQFEIDFPHSAASLVPIETPAPAKRTYTKHKKGGKRTKQASKARRAPVKTGGGFDHASSNGHQADILAALKTAGGSMKPGDLMRAVGAHSGPALTYWLKPLIDAKQVIATGATLSRRFSLPGHVPKEHL